MKEMMLILCVLYLSVTEIVALNINVTCNRTVEDENSAEWCEEHKSYPSVLRDFNIQLSKGPALSMNISWTINIDRSIHDITGTWIELDMLNQPSVRYRCEYQPSFGSRQMNYTGLKELQFYFITTDFDIKPQSHYYVFVQNDPPPPLDNVGSHKKFHVPGCRDERMRAFSQCSITQRNTTTPADGSKSDYETLKVSAVLIEKKIEVVFTSQSGSKTYDIRVRRGKEIIDYAEVLTNGAVRKHKVPLNLTGACEGLSVWVTPHFEYCARVCRSVKCEVQCTVSITDPLIEEPEKRDTSVLFIGVGLILIFFLMLIRLYCFCKHGLASDAAGPVEVLIVYPAVDNTFQQAVLVLADFLQSHRGLNVIIDIWQRSKLAEQGPLLWLNAQVEQADKVLILLPPQHRSKETGFEGSPSETHAQAKDFTVPASTHQLFSMALNLAASSAHDSRRHAKFWVLHMGIGACKGVVPVQLKGCRSLTLFTNVEKLHQKLASNKRLLSSKCLCVQTTKKVKHSLLKLNRSPPTNAEMVAITSVLD